MLDVGVVNMASCFSCCMFVYFLKNYFGFRPKKDVINTIHCHALDDSPLRPKGLDVFANPRERFNSRQVKFTL